MQDIRRQISIAIRWLPLVLIFAVAAGTVAFAWSSNRPVVVEATATLRVDPGLDPSIQDRSDAMLAAVQYAAEMSSPGFAQSVLSALGLDETRDELLKQVSIDVDPEADVGLIQLAVRSTDPQKAQAIAKTFGDELIARKTDKLYTPDIKQATQQVRRLENDSDALRRRLASLRNKNNKQPEDFSQIASLPGEIASLQQAIAGLRPFTTPYVRNLPAWYLEPRLPEPVGFGPLYWTLLAVLAGGMAAVGLAFVIEYLRTLNKVRDERDLELVTGLASLGTVVEARGDAKQLHAERVVMLHYPRSEEAEAYRGLIARIGFAAGSARTLMVASATPSDVTSLVAANLAVAYAEAGRNVILVDADYRAPRIHKFFGVENDRGLTTILADSGVPLGWATVPSPHPRLGLMLAGPVPRETAEPLGSRQLNALLRRLLQAADMVIFDSPAIVANLDASVLAEAVGESLLVVPRDSTEDETAEASRALQVVETEFLGAVLYRQVRRSRRGARTKVAPAPKGWSPLWPMLYDLPARIPEVTKPAHAPEPRSSRPPHTAPMQMPSRPAPGSRQPSEQPGPVSRTAPATPISTGPTTVPGRSTVPGRPSPAGPYAAPFDPTAAKSQPPSLPSDVGHPPAVSSPRPHSGNGAGPSVPSPRIAISVGPGQAVGQRDGQSPDRSRSADSEPQAARTSR